MEIGNIVTTKNDDTHKRIIGIDENRLTLEFYEMTGRQVIFVSLVPENIGFVSQHVTKQWLEMKTLWENGVHSFHNEIENRRKKAYRVELSRRAKRV